MNPFKTHLINTSSTRLSPEEKSAMRSVLLRRMEETPIPSPYLPFIARWPQLVRVASGTLVILLLIGTTTYAAQDALPGDLLYPIKTQVEKLQGAFALTDKAKIEWNQHIAVERIKEAEQLAVSNRLSTSTAAQIESNFDVHMRQASVYTKKVSEKDTTRADEISAQFSASLDQHSDVLAKLSTIPIDASTTATTTNERNSKKLSDHVRARAAEIINDVRTVHSEQNSDGNVVPGGEHVPPLPQPL